MRAIFVLHDRLDPNAGAGGTMAGLGDQLEGRGHRVEYCSFDLLPERLSHNAKTILWPAYLVGRLGRSVRRDPPDVVDASVWLRDPRDFHEMNKAYGEFFKKNQPTRSIFRIDFMFDCRVEIKVTAYRPLKSARRRLRA